MQEFLKFVRQDWYFAIPMFCMSLVAITMVIWRILLNRSANTNMSALLPELQETLAKEGVDGALRYCQNQPGMIPRRLFVAGLETSRQGLAAMRRAMANVIELEVLPDLKIVPGIVHAVFATRRGLIPAVRALIDALAVGFQHSGEGASSTSGGP